jgi:hypothetical protein
VRVEIAVPAAMMIIRLATAIYHLWRRISEVVVAGSEGTLGIILIPNYISNSGEMI